MTFVIDPTLNVEDSPVILGVTSMTGDIDPTLNVEDSPVGSTVTLTAVDTDPILAEKETPVGSTTIAFFSSPHSSSPQDFAPQPHLKVVDSFQLACPQVNRPHPEVTSGT